VVGTADAYFGTSAFTIVVPLSALGGDEGSVNVAAVLGNSTGPTDCVPNVIRLYLPLVLR
jgi:hypothetical protein